jgi:serine/threonine protein kinase
MDAGTAELPEDDRVAPGDGGLAPGTMIGRFVVRGRLGAGGMGVVYAAEDADLGRPVALKLVRPDADRPGLRARLLREAQAMAHIDHPHVVRVHEVGEHGPHLFVAMELIEGETLGTWLRAGRHGWRAIVAMFVQAGRGLAAVHAAGLVHRDVKPDNVLVDGGGRARIADLGLVRVEPARSDEMSPALAASLTRTGMAIGTPGFMAPEQQRGEKVDAQADQYSFCVALREALRDVEPAPPRGVRAAIQRGLSFDAADRFPSMSGLLAAIERGTRGEQRGVIVAIAIGLAVLAGSVVIAATAGGGERAEAPPEVVRSEVTAPTDAGIDAMLDAAAPPPVEDVAGGGGSRDVAARKSARPTSGKSPSSAAPRTRPDGLPEGATVAADGLITLPDGFSYYPPPAFARPGEPPPPPKPKPVLRDKLDPAHLAAVRAAVRDLGHRDYELADLDGDPGAQLRAAEEQRDQLIADGKTQDLELGIAHVILGEIERRRTSCAAAKPHWDAGIKVLVAIRQADPHDKPSFKWLGRIHFSRALCRLAAGDLKGAAGHLDDAVMLGWGGAGALQLAELDLANGITLYERGDLETARVVLRRAGHEGDDRVRKALEGWLAATGATLRGR